MTERPLWAPWRIEYIVGPKAGECIFCAVPRATGEHLGPAETREALTQALAGSR